MLAVFIRKNEFGMGKAPVDAERRIVEGEAMVVGRAVWRRDLIEHLGVGLEGHKTMGEANRHEELAPVLSRELDGDIDVEDDAVRVEVRMPLLLSLFAHKIQQIVSQNGTKLLTKQ